MTVTKFPLVSGVNKSLPPVGGDIYDWAKRSGKSPEHIVRRCLYGGGGYRMEFSVNAAGDKKLMQVVPGHLWYADPSKVSGGPQPADVMIVGKALNDDDTAAQRVYTGAIGRVLLESFRGAGWNDSQLVKLYLTTMLKTTPLDWTKTTIPKLWITSQIHLLWQEILLVRPRYVLLQGAEVVKAVLGSKATLAKLESEPVTLQLDFNRDVDGTSDMADVTFVASISPAAVLHDRRDPHSSQTYRTHVEQRFSRQLKELRRLAYNETDTQVADIEVQVVDNLEDLEDELRRMRAEAENGLVAWDAEWQGAHPQNVGAYLRCVQFAYSESRGVVLALRHPGGAVRFRLRRTDTEAGDEAIAAAMRMCQQYMQGMRAVGHYFTADLEWLVPSGCDLRDAYDAPLDPEDVHRGKGGLATELMAHAWDETAKFSLDEQIAAHLSIPMYSSALEAYKRDQKEVAHSELSEARAKYTASVGMLRKARRMAANGRRWYRSRSDSSVIEVAEYLRDAEIRFSEELAQYTQAKKRHTDRLREMDEGYGWMDDDVLYRYGAWDVVAELMLGKMYLSRLRADRHGNDVTKAYWLSHRAALPVWEMNSTGIPADRHRIDYFAEVFSSKAADILADIRADLRWPDFNPRSRYEFAEVLFGEQYNGYWQQYGKRKRTRPAGALTIRAVPLRTTGRYPMEWEEAVFKTGGLCTPSTGKQTLGEMFYAKDQLRVYRKEAGRWCIRKEDWSGLIGKLRDFRYMDKAMNALIRAPSKNSDAEIVKDEEGWNNYDKGIVHMICGDGRVRTRIRQTVETGRWASYDPNLTNLSKSRESDYRRILKDKFTTSIRTIFTASPGWFLVEADYSGAELLMAAILAGDGNMIDHCQRNTLGDDHPNFYDIHSALTVKAFRLSCEPTKKALQAIKKDHLRTVAKSVIFGLLYGRSPRAIAIAVRQEGVYITEAEATEMVAAVFTEYPRLQEFLHACKDRVRIGWLRNMFGRYRRFSFTDDETKRKAFEREAMNAPMQGGVADGVSTAARNLYDYRNSHGMDFKLLLQIHDALMLHVPHYELERVIEPNSGVLKTCMVDAIELRQTDLDGNLTDNDEVYRFGIGIDVYGSWGDIPDPARFLDYGMSPGIVGWTQRADDSDLWINPEKRGLCWSRKNGLYVNAGA